MIHCGDCLEILRTLPTESVNCCVTSPPYYGLRDYGVSGQIGLEQSPNEYISKLVAVFREVKRVLRNDATLWLNLGDSYAANRGYQVPDNKHIDVGNSKGMNATSIGLKPKDLIGIPWRVAFALQQPYYTGKIRNERDRVWLAAMIDGEGCMFIHKRKAGQNNGQGYERKSDTYSAGLEVANTHESIVRRCMEITGIGSICRVERETKTKMRNLPLYRWNVRSNQCRDIIKEVYPYLIGKQHEARLLLGCPSSGVDAEKAHLSLMALHNGGTATIDFPAPKPLYEQGYYLRQDIIWNKNNPMPESVKDRCTKAHEYVFLLSKSARYFYDCEAVREPIKQTSGLNFRARARTANGALGGDNKHHMESRVFTGVKGANRRSVWTIPTKPYKGAHFATFPPALVEPCILAGCPAGGTVIDPFFGSGTVGAVAVKHGRDFVGIELNPEYIALAEKRIRATQPPLMMAL